MKRLYAIILILLGSYSLKGADLATTAFNRAQENQDAGWQEIKKMIEQGQVTTDAQDTAGKTLLMYAAQQGRINNIHTILSKMLSTANDNANIKDSEGNNALDYVLMHLNAFEDPATARRAIRKLLIAGAKPGTIAISLVQNLPNTALKNELLYLLQQDHTNDFAKKILKERGLEPDQYVARAAANWKEKGFIYNWQKAKELINAGHSVIDYTAEGIAEKHMPLLHLAATHNNTQVVKDLLDAGANINLQKTPDNYTPVMSIVANLEQKYARKPNIPVMLETLKLLVDRGADLSLTDTSNQDVYALARKIRKQELKNKVLALLPKKV